MKPFNYKPNTRGRWVQMEKADSHNDHGVKPFFADVSDRVAGADGAEWQRLREAGKYAAGMYYRTQQEGDDPICEYTVAKDGSVHVHRCGAPQGGPYYMDARGLWQMGADGKYSLVVQPKRKERPWAALVGMVRGWWGK